MPDPPAATLPPIPPRPVSSQDYLFSLNRDLKALNASVLVITQKIKYLVRNEKILGRNLIVINKRVRDLQTQMGGTEGQGVSEQTKAAIDDLMRQVNSLSQRLVEIETKLDELNKRSAKEEEVKEIKYIVDNLNPLHLVTMDQAEQMIEKKLGKR